MYSTGRDGGQMNVGGELGGPLRGLTGLTANGMPDEKTPSLVAHFPYPRWDETTSEIAFEKLMQRLHERAVRRTRLAQAAIATGVAALAAAAWVVL